MSYFGFSLFITGTCSGIPLNKKLQASVNFFKYLSSSILTFLPLFLESEYVHSILLLIHFLQGQSPEHFTLFNLQLLNIYISLLSSN